jgi:putative ABC transport system ATP-binding protein
MEPIISLNNVSVIYQEGLSSEVRAVQDISLEIFPEEYVIFFGPSGSGKSTLLYLISGLEKPTRGNIMVEGNDLSVIKEKELIQFHRKTTGIIFQAFFLIPNLSILDNILLPQIFSRSGKKERQQRAGILAERFGISHLLYKKPTELSGGQQQRVAAVRALINEPKIVLADEPVGNLDTKNAEITMGLLDELNSIDKKTVILVTHDPRYIPYAHRVFHLKDGMIVDQTVNPKKQHLAYSKKSGEGEYPKGASLKRPYLEDPSVMAGYIVRQAISQTSMSEELEMRSLVKQYLSGQISDRELFDKFDAPKSESGLGLNSKTAEHLVCKIREAALEAKLLSDYMNNKDRSLESIFKIRTILLEDYHGSMSDGQNARFDKFLIMLLGGNVSCSEFLCSIDEPWESGGVGLKQTTVRNIERKLEILNQNENEAD